MIVCTVAASEKERQHMQDRGGLRPHGRPGNKNSWFLTPWKMLVKHMANTLVSFKRKAESRQRQECSPVWLCVQNHSASCKNHQWGEVMFVVTGSITAASEVSDSI